MNIKFHFYAAGAGLTTLVAILLSVREQLLQVGPWVLDALIASATATLAYGAFRAYVAGKQHWLTMRAQELAVLGQGQHLRLESEQHDMTMLALRADIHVKLSRAYADPNGNYPALLPGTFISPVLDEVLMLPAGQGRAMQQRLLGEGKYPGAELTPILAPMQASFREVMTHIQPELVVNGKKKREAQVVLAMDHDGAVLGEILDWLSTLVVGMPGMGKSTALYFFIAQLMMLTARFQVLDPHASLISLKDLLPYVNRVDGCIACAPLIEAELERRMDRYEENDGVCLDEHYMLIVDELPAIADKEQQLAKAKQLGRSLIDVLRRVVCEGRKYKMYCMVVGQSIPATILPTIARDNMSSRYVFNCSASHARMAGLDGKAIEEMLPHLDKQKGRCIVAPARMKPFIGAIPMTDVEDLRAVIAQVGYTREGWESEETEEEMETLQPKRLWAVPPGEDTDEVEQDDELMRGIEVYQAGHTTLDAFSAAMGYRNANQGRFLWGRVKLALKEGA